MSDQGSKTTTIRSEENSSRVNLLVLGFLALLVFLGIGYVLASEAYRTANVLFGALSVVVVLIGFACFHLALKNLRTFKVFGPTPLTLDPVKPAIGGQLGASFSLRPQIDNPMLALASDLTATLTCIRVSSGRSDTTGSIAVVWDDKVPVFQTQTSQGIDAKCVFDIPEVAPSSDEKGIRWDLTVEGNFEGLGKLTRAWSIPIEKTAVREKSTLIIPDQITGNFQSEEQKKALAESIRELPAIDDDVNVNIISNDLPRGAEVVGCLFGFVFSCVGLYIIRDGEVAFGAVFLFFGMIGFCLALLGAAMRINFHVNKATRYLQIKNTVFGFTRSSYECRLLSADQFVIRNAGGEKLSGGISGLHDVCFFSDGEVVKIKTWIEGKRNAQAIRDRIVAQLFADTELAAAA